MNAYEAMILVRPDLSEDEKKSLFDKINQAISSKEGKVQNAEIWANKKKLSFNISSTLTSGSLKRYNEALYYLVKFSLNPTEITKLRRDFKLNDAIIRVLIIRGRDDG